MKRASLALLLLVVLAPAAGTAGECPNCASVPMPGYPTAAFRMEVRDDGGGFTTFCDGTPNSYPFLHVTPGNFVAWTLDAKAAVPYVVVTFGVSPFDDDVSVFVVYRGQWTWARVRESIKPDPDALCGADNEDAYTYTITTLGASPRSGPGIIVCPPGNPTCH